MGIVHGINDPPTVYEKVKTTIKKGVIVREKVWMDTMGNELKKVGGNKYTVTKPHYEKANIYQPPRASPVYGSYGTDPLDENSERTLVMIIIASVIIAFIMGCITGHVVALRKRSQVTSLKSVQSPRALETFQTVGVRSR